MNDSPVIVYGAVWCAFCKQAEAYLTKIGVKYIEKDIDKDPDAAKEAVEKSGVSAVPVIDVNGTIILGFDKPKLDSALKAAKLVK
jgi:glutaredoxin 3